MVALLEVMALVTGRRRGSLVDADRPLAAAARLLVRLNLVPVVLAMILKSPLG
jgi:hypothetical protein